MRNSPVIQMRPAIVLMSTQRVREPASADATRLTKPALGSASATQPTTRMKGGTSMVASLVNPVATTQSNLASSLPDSRLSRKPRPSPLAASSICPALLVRSGSSPASN